MDSLRVAEIITELVMENPKLLGYMAQFKIAPIGDLVFLVKDGEENDKDKSDIVIKALVEKFAKEKISYEVLEGMSEQLKDIDSAVSQLGNLHVAETFGFAPGVGYIMILRRDISNEEKEELKKIFTMKEGFCRLIVTNKEQSQVLFVHESSIEEEEEVEYIEEDNRPRITEDDLIDLSILLETETDVEAFIKAL